MKRSVIIHLSDIHYDGTDSTNILLDNLQKDLSNMKINFNDGYDLLILTGDCINRGKTNLFPEFSDKLKEILKVCNLRKNRAVIVPGNHDSVRENTWLSAIKNKYNESKCHQDEMIKDIENDISPLYKEYNEFVEDYSNQKNGIGVKYYTIKDMIVRVIFLNSAWSTLAHCKYGELYIGDEQLDKIKNIIDSRKKKYDITIACLHHPLDWFRYDERVKLQEFLYSRMNVDFILHGHIHEASYESVSNMDIYTNTFCTGISYHKTGENCSRKDGMRYSIYEIDYDTRTINVYLRATNQNSEFVSDNRLYSKVNKDGFFSLPLGNINECLMPINSVTNSSGKNVFLNYEFVKKLMEKEDLLFKFYCGMEECISESFVNPKTENFEKFKQNWKINNNKKKIGKSEQQLCEKAFYIEQFEIYCMFVLNTLNGLFFKNHKHVRFLLRKYNKKSEKHEAFLAEGIYSDNIEHIKAFKWGEGMICKSYEKKAALLQSRNMEYHENGNSNGIWKDYLTIAVGGIELRKGRDLIPLLSLNIATDILENEKCLQALALSSIYDKIQEVFKLYNANMYDLVSLYDE